jgi:hypothetical protein
MRAKLLALLALIVIVVGVGVSRWTVSRQRDIVLAQSSQTGPWIPLVAKRTARVYQDSANGMILTSESTGNYFRDRAGSVYQRDLSVLGARPDSIAHFEDLQEGKVYEINYPSKTATVIGELGMMRPRQPLTADEFREQFASAQWIGKKVISGVECEGYRILPGAGGSTQGEMWVAPSLNFLPVQHKIIDREHHAEIVLVLDEIHAGVDPDPGFLKVPEGFAVGERISTPSGK